MNEIFKHCCSTMDYILKEDKVLVKYDPVFREYYIKLRHDTAKQCMFYCPWCAQKLPHSLRDSWFDILQCDYKLQSPREDLRKIPKEFRTDEWWKKRGL